MTSILSDIINGRKIIFWEGILTEKDNGRVVILRDKLFLHQNSLGQPGGIGFPLTGALLHHDEI